MLKNRQKKEKKRGNSKGFKDLIMFMRVPALVFLFLICLRFSHSNSVAEVIRKMYQKNRVKKLRKLEKLDCRLRKAQIFLDF